VAEYVGYSVYAAVWLSTLPMQSVWVAILVMVSGWLFWIFRLHFYAGSNGWMYRLFCMVSYAVWLAVLVGWLDMLAGYNRWLAMLTGWLRW
jgi:hypothetical protein